MRVLLSVPLLLLGSLVCPNKPLFAEQLRSPLNRNWLISEPLEEVWGNTIKIVQNSDAVVGAADSASHLISMTVPISDVEVPRYLLDAREMPRQPQMAHILIWVQAATQGQTHLFIRAAFEIGGIFGHSNGRLEEELFRALSSGEGWRKSEFFETAIPSSSQEAWRQTLEVVSASGAIVNCAEPDLGLLTFSVDIPSDALGRFAEQGSGYHAGSGHMSVWVREDGALTRLRINPLFIEVGHSSPPALRSKGTLEAELAEAVSGRLAGQESTFSLGSRYRRDRDLWWVLFGIPSPDADTLSSDGLLRVLPASRQKVWEAALTVLTQFAVIAECDWATGQITFVAAHPSDLGSKFSVHPMSILLQDSELGIKAYATAAAAREPQQELDQEKREILVKIANQLFIKEKLRWLLKDQKASPDG